MKQTKIYQPIEKLSANDILTNQDIFSSLSQNTLIELYFTKVVLLETLEKNYREKDDFYYENFDSLNTFDQIQTRWLIQALQELINETQIDIDAILPLIIKH